MSGSNHTALIPRARTIEPRPGLRFRTPLLVPSFSSKGFPISGKKRRRSALSDVLTFIGGSLTESALFSAYDIHYKLIPNARPFLDKPGIVFLDSGGYEASDHYDEGQTFQPPYKHNKWSELKLRQVIDSLPKRLRLVIVNHDERGALDQQAANALHFFSQYPGHVHDFLLKPQKQSWNTVDVDDVIERVNVMTKFDIIGVTEKELGASLLDRLVNVHNLRQGLDKAGVNAPIHVFGSLDPLTVPLYASAGAEVFDGLSWLRYYFHEGLTVYRDHAALLKENRGAQTRWDHVRALAVNENVALIRQLEFDLRAFAISGDCEVFGPTGKAIERGLQALRSRLYGGS